MLGPSDSDRKTANIAFGSGLMGMKREGPPRDDLDVSLQWPAGDLAGEGFDDDLGPDSDVSSRVAASLDTRLVTESLSPDLDSLVAAIDSMRSVINDLADSLASMQKTLQLTSSKVDRLATRPPAVRETSDDVGQKLAELTHQVELLRKRMSLRARSEQLSSEAAELIAAAVIDNFAEIIPEAGPRLRSRRRTERS